MTSAASGPTPFDLGRVLVPTCPPTRQIRKLFLDESSVPATRLEFGTRRVAGTSLSPPGRAMRVPKHDRHRRIGEVCRLPSLASLGDGRLSRICNTGGGATVAVATDGGLPCRQECRACP